MAINDLYENDVLVYLLKYDTVMSTYYKTAKIEGDYLVTPDEKVLMLSQSDMAQLPWKDLGIDVVVEATGVFRKKSQLEAHLQAGAKRVILTVPSKDEIDATIVIGVNEDALKPEHRIVSNASCTTNCLAPVAKVLHMIPSESIDGLMTTTHAVNRRPLELPRRSAGFRLQRLQAWVDACFPPSRV